jgi:hypothetical protein
MKPPPSTFLLTIPAVAALLIATGCSKHNPSPESKPTEPPVLVEPNAGVGKVQKGMNRDQVEAAIGKPERINGLFSFYSRRGMFVGFGNDGVMFNIKCTRPFAGVTKEGIGIGSTRAELLAAYGNPSEEKHFKDGDNLWFAPIGISFDVENDKVTSFIVHLNAR